MDVTTPEGCTFSKSITLTVHSQNNLAPWMDGVNGTGDYTFYMSSDQYFPPYSFTSNFYNDNFNELITSTEGPTNIPPPNTPPGQMTFGMQTGGITPYETPNSITCLISVIRIIGITDPERYLLKAFA